MIQTSDTFDVLGDLPEWISNAIREDGREVGEWVAASRTGHQL